MVKIAIEPEEARHIRQKYAPIPQNDGERIIESMEVLIEKYLSERITLNDMLREIAVLIHRRFEFKEVSIGLRDADGKFRHKVMQGYTAAAEAARRSMVYTPEDMAADSEKFPSISIGRNSEFLNGETLPEELATFNKPSQISRRRGSLDELKEGDYIDTFIYGRNKEMIGWIEVSGAKDGKLPDRSTVIWLELIGSFLGLILAKDLDKFGALKLK